MKASRIEKDSLGEIEVAGDAYWGAQTERARRNFPVSGLVFQRRFVAALGLIKGECAAVNAEMGIVDRALAEKIQAAALEVYDGTITNIVRGVTLTGPSAGVHPVWPGCPWCCRRLRSRVRPARTPTRGTSTRCRSGTTRRSTVTRRWRD